MPSVASKSKAGQQIMAPLPLARVQTSLRAFNRTSVDFGGPVMNIQGRGKRREKRYLCLFTCLAIRAVHLEIGYRLSTDSFLNAFYRMASRRGLPDEVYSGNGTNDIGADRELQALLVQVEGHKIKESVANKGVKWKFNLPLAPNFGGAHESMVKSAEKAIKAQLGQADIKDEELMTAITGPEGLINSGPLTYQSANHVDDVPLTLNHFLHGQVGGQFAPTSVDEMHISPRKRWRCVQELVRQFWKKWLREWLPGLSAKRSGTGKDKTYRHLVRYTADMLAYGMSHGVISGRRQTGACCQGPGREGHLDTTNLEVLSFGRRDVGKLFKEQLTIYESIQKRNLSLLYLMSLHFIVM